MVRRDRADRKGPVVIRALVGMVEFVAISGALAIGFIAWLIIRGPKWASSGVRSLLTFGLGFLVGRHDHDDELYKEHRRRFVEEGRKAMRRESRPL
jgi:hypothetical protein